MKRYERLKNEIVAGGSVQDVPEADQQSDDDPRPGALESILGVGLIVLLFGWLLVTNVWMFVFAIGILVSVFLHETGHYLTAKLTGMKVTQFFLGFGPRIWSFQRGETEYGLRALPLGAFVRIIGMNNMDDVPRSDEARTYRQQSYPKRMLVISAGSIMHIIIAVVLLFAVFATKGKPEQIDGAVLDPIEQASPADRAGIRPDDVVMGFNGEPINDGDELVSLIRRQDPGDQIELTVLRDRAGSDMPNELTIPVVLDEYSGTDDARRGDAVIGVGVGNNSEWVGRSVGKAGVESVSELFPVTWESTKGIVTVLNPVNIWSHLSGENDDITTRPTTVVGVTQVSGTFGETDGLAGILYLLAALNVFIGVFNMFPLLPLDGGHAAIATYERFRERRGQRYFADVSKMMPVAMAVMAALLLLFVSGLYLDITKPLG